MVEQKIFDKNGKPLSIISQLGEFLKNKAYEKKCPLQDMQILVSLDEETFNFKLNLLNDNELIDSWDI